MGEKIKILFISPEFYQYTNAIISELDKHNVETVFYPWWPHLNLLSKYFFKKKENVRRRKMNKYLNKIIKDNKDTDFALILLNSAITFNREQIQRLNAAFPKARKIFFMWDSIVNYPVTETFLDLFDKFYSFDKVDCEKYHLIYRADFADPALMAKESLEMDKDIDLFFIGSVDPYRYRTLKKVEKYCLENNLTYKFVMFFRSKTIFRLNKLFYKDFRKAKASEFIFKPIVGEEKDKLFARSKAMLEIVRERQNGMSMRSIESSMIGMKMITTQEAIKLYNLYNENNIGIISDDDYSAINSEFLNREFEPLDKKVLEEYSVSSFVKTIILDNLK